MSFVPFPISLLTPGEVIGVGQVLRNRLFDCIFLRCRKLDLNAGFIFGGRFDFDMRGFGRFFEVARAARAGGVLDCHGALGIHAADVFFDGCLEGVQLPPPI